MTSSNRASKLESLHKSLKKHFKPVPDPPERSVLEHLLYACCLEDARFEQADEAFAKLQQTYFDWNEVRVTTVAELGDALHSLPFASQAAQRIKQCLQALFESRYQYDIDDMKKANLGKAVAELEAWKGITPFVVSYVSQHALGGHSIPVSQVILEALVQCEIVSPAEAEKKSVPGLERAIPKNKGVEFGNLLQQFANELQLHPKSNVVQTVLKELGVTLKAKPKAMPKPPEPAQTSKKLVPPKQESEKGDDEDKAKSEKPQTKSNESKESAAKETSKPAATKKMTPPASSKTSAATKDSSAKKSQGDEKKKVESSKEAGKKPAGSKSQTDDAKSKSPPSSKATPAKNKPPAKPATKKGASPGKSSGGSIASSITKKKPK